MLSQQYEELSELYSSWKILFYEHKPKDEETQEQEYYYDEEDNTEDWDYEESDDSEYSDDIYRHNEIIEDIKWELESKLKLIKRAINSHNSNLLSFLFEEAEQLCGILEIDYNPDYETINNDISITKIKRITTLYTIPKTILIIPKLIIPTQEYLISLIKNDPKLIFGITSRQFEELIAEIFHNFGFDVELTQATRDGGRDIIAINEIQKIKTKYLIECKRYEPSHKISVSIVRNLWAVKMHESANKAILVTTSSYTRDAKMFASKHVWDLDLKGYNDIIQWVNRYKLTLPPRLT